ncbi:MAG: sodium:calcium antiporter [Hyphomonas sp. 34-62-18]|nr:calcium/sodium antiporter [Hyphomonas sp. 34-62-18]OZB17788.1 MAG: sodium:calcium antiporter [Hyphomonas sp. 34-62-18]
MDYVFVLSGFVLLFLGGEGLVRGSVAIADRFGLSKLIIGLTIVGFGTSAPELIVSAKAALDGAPSIALGNVVGSNVANVLLIIGAAGLIYPISGWQRSATRDGLIMTLAALALFGFAHTDVIGRIEGAALLCALLIYLLASYWLEMRDKTPRVAEEETGEFETPWLANIWVAALAVIVSIAILMTGADLLVRGSVNIASALGVSDAAIGLTVVAVGTSLPELATAIVAAIRRHADVILGNVIGSNIFNVLGILGTTALIAPIPVAQRFTSVDTPFMLAVMAGLVLLLVLTRRIGRITSGLMLSGYVVYTISLFAAGGAA